MKTTIRLFLGGYLVFCSLLAFQVQAETYQEGVDYIKLLQPIKMDYVAGQTGEVWSFFRYTCSGCYQFHPILETWQSTLSDDTKLRLLPIFQPGPYAGAYYAAELLDIDPKFHHAVYDKLHTQRKAIRKMEDFADIATQFGVDVNEFIQAANSFSTSNQIKQGERWAVQAGVRVTPTMVVNGQYFLTANMVGSNQKMLQVVDYLLAKDSSKSN